MGKYLDLDDVVTGNPVAKKELAELRSELAAEKEKNSDLTYRLQDWIDSAKKAWKTPCADEQHCSCVPLLRKKCDELQSELEAERMEYEAYRETSIVEAENLRAELEKLKRQWAEDDRDITELEDENNQLRAELAAEKTRVDDLRHFRKVFRDQRDGAEAQVEGLREVMVRLYNTAYHAGHDDTVEGQYTDVSPVDMDSYHEDIVEEWLSEHDLPARAAAVREVLDAADELVTSCQEEGVEPRFLEETRLFEAVRERREK